MTRQHIAVAQTLTASYVAFPSTVITTGIFVPRTGNTGTVYVQGDDGSDIPVTEFYPVQSIQLSTLKFKGTANDKMDFLGSTR